MGTYSIWESMIYPGGLLPQSYCQVIKLFVWLALFRSPGVSPAAKARPRFFLAALVGELLLDVLVELVLDVLLLDALVGGFLLGVVVEESLLDVVVEESLLVVLLGAATERMTKVEQKKSDRRDNNILGRQDPDATSRG
jgi:hypothetical protein